MLHFEPEMQAVQRLRFQVPRGDPSRQDQYTRDLHGIRVLRPVRSGLDLEQCHHKRADFPVVQQHLTGALSDF